ncbi:ribosome-binding factor A [Natranaerovirga hydrolytica]|uniref:Ribosome-binding factor A n=1 Tax=Natranaerovirga hydrolytica TaxID=680378 RepID=A0A4R1MZA4_9FIRM|nr:30S ribosome-binding factor RbfA [Natranaerovirga hydrolytica]TCK97940.1 ribosome-binding factor A [Natranaerovirga hydrolytica]
MKKKSSRLIRINEEIKKELSNLIRTELKDPRVNPMTTVVNVHTTSDLKHCKVFISVLGNEEDKEETVNALNKASSFIRTEIARLINLRNTPELKFIKDDSIEQSIHMSKIIDEISKKDE